MHNFFYGIWVEVAPYLQIIAVVIIVLAALKLLRRVSGEQE